MRRSIAAAGVAAILAACAAPGAAPTSSDVYADYLIGRVANARNDYGAAADRYFAALSRSPSDEALVGGALEATLIAGDEARARRAAAMARGDEAPALARLVRATDAIRASNWSSAARELDAVSGSAVDEMLARTLLVWVRVGQRRPDEVTAQLAPLTNIRPYGALFSYQQAMGLDYVGRGEEALAAFDTAAGGEMFLPPAAARHAEALLRANRQADALAMLARVNDRGDPALARLTQRIESGSGAGGAQLTPARGAAIGLYGLGAILLQQEHNADAGLVAISLALMLDPELDIARILFAEGHRDGERFALARETLARIGANSPYAQTARIMEAGLLMEGGRQDEAIAAAQGLARGGDPLARRVLADMYTSIERYADAEPIYSALLSEDERNWRLLFARGAARERLGRWPEAEADFRQALVLSPNEPDILNYLGYTWVDRGENLQEGLAMIRRAAELRPTSGAIMDSLGWAYFRLGDYPQALMYLERAVELEPGSATLNDHLGDVYWRVGRRTEARFQWRRALTQDPDDRAALEAKIENGLPGAP